MQIQIVREDEVKVSVFSEDTPLEEVMDDVYSSHRGIPGRKPVTAVQLVDSHGRVQKRLTASAWRAAKEERERLAQH